MNILITGGNGQLGTCFKNIINKSVCKNNYIFTDIDTLDLTDTEKVKSFIDNNSINMVINCSAYTNVDKAEEDILTATLVNSSVPSVLGNFMKDVNGVLIHISTDYVFGSQFHTPIGEDFEHLPENVYGRTKTNGEYFIKCSGCDYLIFRTSWLYSEYGNNFTKKMMELTSNKDEIKVVIDQIGTPTYAMDLAKTIVDIVEQEKYKNNFGIYHYSNEGVCSWYDFATMINEYSGHTCNVKPCNSSEFPSNVKRPIYSVLDKSKIKSTFGINIPHWTTSLKTCVKNLKEYEV